MWIISYKVKYVFISSLTFNTRISYKLLNKVNEMIEGDGSNIELEIKKKICKNPTKENKNLYKKQGNKYAALRRKYIKEFFHNISNNITLLQIQISGTLSDLFL